eukprot:m.470174 g.470174  ORF g.470174 m.470174 type:complete len:361 (+) comp20368_c0_seq4:2685-3767(+)
MLCCGQERGAARVVAVLDAGGAALQQPLHNVQVLTLDGVEHCRVATKVLLTDVGSTSRDQPLYHLAVAPKGGEHQGGLVAKVGPRLNVGAPRLQQPGHDANAALLAGTVECGQPIAVRFHHVGAAMLHKPLHDDKLALAGRQGQRATLHVVVSSRGKGGGPDRPECLLALVARRPPQRMPHAVGRRELGRVASQQTLQPLDNLLGIGRRLGPAGHGRGGGGFFVCMGGVRWTKKPTLHVQLRTPGPRMEVLRRGRPFGCPQQSACQCTSLSRPKDKQGDDALCRYKRIKANGFLFFFFCAQLHCYALHCAVDNRKPLQLYVGTCTATKHACGEGLLLHLATPTRWAFTRQPTRFTTTAKR